MKWTIRAVVGFGVVMAMTGCGAVSGPSSFGSPERTANFLRCLPAALGSATALVGATTKDDKATSAQLLEAVNTRVASGDSLAVVAACAPYVADLVKDGNAQAAAIKARMDARQTPAP